VDESETGSANFFGPVPAGRRDGVSISDVHLRPPSFDPGVTAFLWALGLGLFVWLGLVAIGFSQGAALILALLSFGAIFLFVRTQGADV
jgi:hypothetical protein